MNGLRKVLLPFAGLLLLAGCGTELQKAEGITPQGSSFEKGLYDGYVGLAKGEYGEGDYRDSDTFARRAISAGSGDGIGPEKIEARGLPGDKVDELASARKRLVSALAEGAAERKPLEAAKAQVSFDCWMQEQEENFQPDDIAACRDGFLNAVAQLEEKPEVAAAPEPAPPPALPGPWVVNFDFNGSELTPDARAVLADVVKAAKKADFQTINVGGYTDLVGKDGYNDALSADRTDAVVNFLVQSGIEKGKISGAHFGKRNPVVNTPEPEVKNRRVEIELTR